LIGSMPFAVAILMLVAVAASVGSLLEQNQPYASHVSNFGLLWTEVFLILGLNDVYHAPWFLTLLAFLTLSTGLCVWRNTPLMLREWRSYKQHLALRQLLQLPLRRELHVDLRASALRPHLARVLRDAGYRWRAPAATDALEISAKKGMARRLGYVLTHLAIVVISVGGLVDGNIALQWRLATGQVVPAPLGQPAEELGPGSRIGTGGGAFRGTIRLAPGASGAAVALNLGDGYLLRELPIQVRLNRFQIEYHPTGQPRDFVSDLSVLDPARPGAPQQLRLSMNKPARYGDLSFFQSGFDDGGSGFEAELLGQGGLIAQSIAGRVGSPQPLRLDGELLQLEPDNYHPRNVVAAGDDKAPGFRQAFLRGRQQANSIDLGPSLVLGFRDSAGQRVEQTTYQLPITSDGRRYFVLALRPADAAEPAYLGIPLDDAGSLQTYQGLMRQLRDPARRKALLGELKLALGEPHVQQQLRLGLDKAFERFFAGGFSAVGPAEEGGAAPAHRKVLELMSHLALKALDVQQAHSARGAANAIAKEDPRFVADSLLAYSRWVELGRPPLLRLRAVAPVNATVLQVSHAPGALSVYAGMAMLSLGVILMVLVQERRLWVRELPDGGILMAMTAHRPMPGLEAELDELVDSLMHASAAPNFSTRTTQ
jgi:cytochrome c biogenesis protein